MVPTVTDRQGYEGYALQFSDESRGIVELEAIDKWGSEIASMLYTYRSVARALPTVSGDEAKKRSMYAASFEVLDPVVTRLKQHPALIRALEEQVQRTVNDLDTAAVTSIASILRHLLLAA